MVTYSNPHRITIECRCCMGDSEQPRPDRLIRLQATPEEAAWPGAAMANPAVKERLLEEIQEHHLDCWYRDEEGRLLGTT